MCANPFDLAHFKRPCPPDYNTVLGWYADNEPGVLLDMWDACGRKLSALYAATQPEVRACVAADFDLRAVPVIGSDLAFPSSLLNDVLSKDHYIDAA